MKKLDHESSVMLNGGCRPALCKAMFAVFAVATPLFFPIGAVVGLGAWGTGLWACRGC